MVFENLTDEELTEEYNRTLKQEGRLFKELFTARLHKNNILGEMIRRSGKNGK